LTAFDHIYAANLKLLDKPSVSYKYHIQLNSDIYELTKLQAWFQQFKPFLPNITWMQCNLVLVEVFTNVVSYAHEGMPQETPVDIEIKIYPISKDSGMMELRIWDHGQSFDLNAEIEKATCRMQISQDNLNIDDIPTGGRGLYIAKTVADHINYESDVDGRNCFVMSKNFPRPT
jgi:serine/threonine-protein kinase RsbW